MEMSPGHEMAMRQTVQHSKKNRLQEAVLGVLEKSIDAENGTDLLRLRSHTTLDTSLETAFGNSQHFAEVGQFDRTADSTQKFTVRVVDVDDGIAKVRTALTDQVLGLEELLDLGRNSVGGRGFNEDCDEGHEMLQLGISSGIAVTD